MTWPTTPVSTSQMDATGDNPSLFRADVLDMAQKVNQMIATPPTLGGGRLLNVQVFLTNGTYTPTSGTAFVVVECQGGGGAGGAAQLTSASQVSVGAGGDSGAYCKGIITSGFAGLAVTVGAGGAPVAYGSGAGGSGGSSSFGPSGTIMTAYGGAGGAACAATANSTTKIVDMAKTPANIAGGGSIQLVRSRGETGGAGFIHSGAANGMYISGNGAPSVFGPGGKPLNGQLSSSGVGQSGLGYGSGGSGALCNPSTGSSPQGGAGVQGVVIVWEYA